MNKITRWQYHGFFWITFVILNGYVSGRYDLLFARAYCAELWQLPVNLVAVYTVFSMRIPRNNKQLIFWVMALICIVFLGGFMNRLMMYYVIHPQWYADYTMEFWNGYRILVGIFDVAFVLSLALALRFGRRYFLSSKREQALIIEKSVSELKALRAQINPHFLFNTLTNVYALSRKNAPETPDVVLRLSNLLRYMLYDCRAERMPIKSEMAILNAYLDLEKIRFGDRLSITNQIELNDPDQLIAPLLWLPFVENAFKHGASESRFNPEIRLSSILKDQKWDFFIENTHEGHYPPADSAPKNIGIANIKRQLELIYPETHQLNIESTDQYFRVHLTVMLT